MAHQDPPAQNDGTAPQRPAQGAPGGTPEAPASQEAPKAAPPLNIIPLTEITAQDHPLVAVCPYCMANLSTVCWGRYITTPMGNRVEVFWPVGCPECHHPLLYLRQSPVIPASRLPSA